jgi:hypothetical protein
VCYDKNEVKKTEMTYNEINQRNENLAPTTALLARHNQRLSREQYEKCCAYVGIESRADEEIRQGECSLTRAPYAYSNDPTGVAEIRLRIDRARLKAMNLTE